MPAFVRASMLYCMQSDLHTSFVQLHSLSLPRALSNLPPLSPSSLMISHRLSPNHPPPNVHCACRHFAAETEKLSKQPGGGGRDDDFDFGSMGAGKGEDGDAGVGDDAGMSESPADDADAPKKWVDMDDENPQAEDTMGDDTEAKIEELPDAAPGDDA